LTVSVRVADTVRFVTAIRIIIGVVIGGIVLIALVPMFVLLDLAGGGDGLGLCSDGIASCRTSYFDGPELIGMLVVVLFLLLMLLRAAFHIRSLIEQRQGVESHGGRLPGSP
jgi:hypothetical protein